MLYKYSKSMLKVNTLLFRQLMSGRITLKNSKAQLLIQLLRKLGPILQKQAVFTDKKWLQPIADFEVSGLFQTPILKVLLQGNKIARLYLSTVLNLRDMVQGNFYPDYTDDQRDVLTIALIMRQMVLTHILVTVYNRLLQTQKFKVAVRPNMTDFSGEVLGYTPDVQKVLARVLAVTGRLLDGSVTGAGTRPSSGEPMGEVTETDITVLIFAARRILTYLWITTAADETQDKFVSPTTV